MNNIRYFFTFFLLVTSISIQAQKGDYILSHYSLDVEGLDNHNFEMKVNSHGQVCIANRSGLLLYEGDNWDFIATPSAALSVDFDNNNKLYMGCAGTFGRIDYEDNKYQFISLNPNKSDEHLYFKTVHLGASIFFMSETNIVRYNSEQGRSNILFTDSIDEHFTNMFEVDSMMMIQTNKTIYQYKDDKLVKEYEWELPDHHDFLFFDKHPTQNKYVAGTSDNNVYIYKDKKFYNCKLTKFLTKHESFVNNGVWVDKDHFALSTLEDGIILYSNRKSKIIDVINQDKGLPDNEIYTISRDQENGLWISHEFGLSRLDITVPFRSFTNYRGLEGNIKDIFWFHSQLYVSTSAGVFALEKKKEYKTTVYYVPKSGKGPSKTATAAANYAKKKNSLSRKKSKSTIQQKNTPPKDKIEYIRKVKKELANAKYGFTRVQGISAKCEKFFLYQKKLFVASSNGLYEIIEEIDEDTKEPILTSELVIHEPIRFIFKENINDRMVIATHYNEIKIFTLEDNIWVEDEQLNFHGELVLGALHQSNGITWFTTPSHLYRYDSLSSTYHDFKTYTYPNQFIDAVKIAPIDNQLYLINSLGYFYLDGKEDKILEDTVLLNKIGKPVRHLQEHGRRVWVYNGENWFQINRDKTVIQRDIFGLFPKMSFITNYHNNIWLIDQSKELLKYYPSKEDTLISKNSVFFRSIRSNKGDINLSESIVFEHDENSFYFELARPDYLGLLKVEYQYKLSGLNDTWSKWSTSSHINFNYLPAGTYDLSIHSRDAFGELQEVHTVDFTIKPPYWQTLWFYALQIGFMTFLMIGSVFMNFAGKKKHLLITEGLSILTIVMVIEFLQSAASGYLGIQSTPVVDLLIDIAIALCVFPLEQYLKKLMKITKEDTGILNKGIVDMLMLSKDYIRNKKSKDKK